MQVASEDLALTVSAGFSNHAYCTTVGQVATDGSQFQYSKGSHDAVAFAIAVAVEDVGDEAHGVVGGGDDCSVAAEVEGAADASDA